MDLETSVKALTALHITAAAAVDMLDLPQLDAPCTCCIDANPGPYHHNWHLKAQSQGHGRRIPQGNAMERELKEIFREQKKQSLREFKGAIVYLAKAAAFLLPGDSRAFFDPRTWTEKMVPRMAPLWGAVMNEGINDVAERLTARVGTVPIIDPLSIKISEAVNGATLIFCETTNAATSLQLDLALGKVREELAAGLLTPDNTLPALTKRVNAVFNQASSYRAERIARTEASRAVHLGQRMEAAESGVVRGYRWLLSADACPICQAIKQSMPEIALDGKFAQIGTGDYSDIWAPPAHPNCMCTITEILIDE